MASISGRGAKGHHTYQLTLTETSTSTEKNESSVDYSFDLTDDANWFWSSWGNSISYSISANGSVIKSGSIPNHTTKNQNIASGSFTVPHDADGSKTLSFSFSVKDGAGKSYTSGNASGSGSMILTQIPRQAEITSVSDFSDVDNPSFTFSNPGGFPIDVWLEPNPVGDHLCVINNIPNTGTHQWKLTDAEREELRNKSNGKSSYIIRVGLYTHISGTTYADYEDKTFTMTENEATKPSVTVNVALNNSSIAGKFNGLYIQGKSKLDVSLSASGKYGANITDLYAVIDGKKYNSTPFTSDAIQSSGNVVGYAKDSRGFTDSDSQPIEVIPYSKPLVVPLDGENAILCYRSDGNGKRVGNSSSVWIKAKRSYYSVSGKNECALRWRRKLTTEEWNNSHQWHDLIASTDASTDEYNALIPGEVFDLKKSYTVQIRAEDLLDEMDTKTFEIPTQDVALHLGKGGKNVSVGTYCDYSKEYTFYSEWDAYFDKDVYIGGTQISNHVVEEGTSGAWKYRKWKDGTAELWGLVTAAHANGSVLGGRLEYPFILTGTVYGIGTLNSAGGNSVAALPWNLKLTYGLDLCEVWVHNSGSVGFPADSTADASVYIVGKWK